MDSATKWRVYAPSALHWHEWDGEHLVYNDLSGDTHYLGKAAACLLRRLQDTALTLADLVDEANRLAPRDGRNWTEIDIQDMVLQFEGFGLIEAAAP